MISVRTDRIIRVAFFGGLLTATAACDLVADLRRAPAVPPLSQRPEAARHMILVTGATGTNGRLIVKALLQAGAPVRAMVQDPARAADLRQDGAELVVADFDRPHTLVAALSGVERSLLLSAVDERLVEREARFVETAKKIGLRHLVKFSAIGAHPAASFTFGRQHGRSEDLVMDSGVPFTFIQP